MSETKHKTLSARMMALFVAMVVSVLAVGMANSYPTYARTRGVKDMSRAQLYKYTHVAISRMYACKNHKSKSFKKASKAYSRAQTELDVRYRAGRRY